jgi:hypothetical protein
VKQAYRSLYVEDDQRTEMSGHVMSLTVLHNPTCKHTKLVSIIPLVESYLFVLHITLKGGKKLQIKPINKM